MASTTAIKRRIKSVRNTRQITKAMQLVAASKMRRAQELAHDSQLYASTAHEILSRLRQMTDVSQHPLFKRHNDVKSRLIVVFTSDGPLAGAYNSNVLKKLSQEIDKDRQAKITTRVIMIGKQGSRWVGKIKDVEVVGLYNAMPDKPTVADMRAIINTIIESYTNAKVADVDLLYTHYINSINQQPEVLRLLPAAFEDVEVPAHLQDATFEPSPRHVLDKVTQRLIEVEIMQSLLEAAASEHSMRMIAMKNATDNAGDIIDDLTLEFNSARQSAITQELAEITGGAEAIS